MAGLRSALWHSEPVATSPSVRVVVVHYGSADLTIRCIEALAKTRWPSDLLDVVVVDNGGDASLRPRLHAVAPRTRVVGDGTNLGFAGGCNVGLRDLGATSRAALINPDAVVEPDWVERLNAAIDAPSIGAASPKLVFSDRYQELQLEVDARQRRLMDPRRLGVRVLGVTDIDDQPLAVHYASGFFGPEGPEPDGVAFQWTTDRARLLLPVAPRALPGGLGRVRVRLGAGEPTAVSFGSGDAQLAVVAGPGHSVFDVPIASPPTDIVNNVGNVLLPDGSGADRGYLEPDDGRYSHPELIEAWCGGAVLFTSDYLRDVGLFDERYFLYYEDLDLAVRGARRGWQYVFVPSVVVRHDHSAIAVDGSAFADHYKERNRLLFAVRNLPPTAAARIVIRYLLSTLSYVRRDVLSPITQGHRPRLISVRRRIGSFLAFCRVAPAMFRARKDVS